VDKSNGKTFRYLDTRCLTQLPARRPRAAVSAIPIHREAEEAQARSAQVGGIIPQFTCRRHGAQCQHCL